MINKVIKFTTIACFLFNTSSAFAKANCVHDPAKLKCVDYVKLHGSNAIIANVPNLHPLMGANLKIRFSNVKMPKLRSKDKCAKKKAKEAKEFLKTSFKNAKRIDGVEARRDRSFAVKGEVKIDGKPLSEILISRRLAVSDVQRNVNWCKL